MIVFFDLDGIVRAKFVPRNTTVSYEYYKGLLDHLRNDVHKKWPEKWANSFILHHDNAPCHTSLLVLQFLSNKNIMMCPHLPYSPDLAPCDFWLFPKVKMTMKVKHFELIQDIEAATTLRLKTLTKEDFQNCFRQCKNNGISVIEVRGSILRGINGNVSFTLIIFFYLNIHCIFWSHNVSASNDSTVISKVQNPSYSPLIFLNVDSCCLVILL